MEKAEDESVLSVFFQGNLVIIRREERERKQKADDGARRAWPVSWRALGQFLCCCQRFRPWYSRQAVHVRVSAGFAGLCRRWRRAI